MLEKTLLPTWQALMTSAMLACSVSAHATTLSISDLDLTSLSFEVDSLTPPLTTGNSNGIGFTLSGNYYTPFSNTSSSQFYNDLPTGYDDLHLSTDFTITFEQPIDYLLVALANNNNSGDGINFGLHPADSIGVSVSGTQISITDIGGALVLYAFDAPLSSISHVNNNGILDGFDVSFFAGRAAVVPVPASIWLFASSLIGLFSFASRGRKDA